MIDVIISAVFSVVSISAVFSHRVLTYLEFTRRQQNKTIASLSAETRIGTYFISLLEQGRGTPSEFQRERLAKALGVAPEDLLKAVDEVFRSRAGGYCEAVDE